MAYEPTEWKSGDVVTSAKLNKIEAGIASGGVLVVTDTEGALDKTWQEIHDAVFAVIKSVVDDGVGYIYIDSIGINGEVRYIETDEGDQYKTNSANGYPVFDPDGGEGGGGDEPVLN